MSFKLQLIAIIEYAYAVMQKPEELSMAIQENPPGKLTYNLMLLLPAVSFSAGLYSLRSIYTGAFWFNLILLTLLAYAFVYILSRVSGSLLDDIARHQIEKGRSLYIISFSFLPFLFFYPASAIARVFETSWLMMLPLSISIIFWSGSAMVRSLAMHYEIPLKSMGKSLFRTFGMTLVFPFVFLFFTMMVIATLAR